MHSYAGQVSEIRLDSSGLPAAWIACPTEAIPAPGRYLLGLAEGDEDAALAEPLFTGQVAEGGFLAAPPIPAHWTPGTHINLRGPLGKGFRIPSEIHHLALVTLGDTSWRLIPLASQALTLGADVALFADAPEPDLPSSIEINPVKLLSESLSWADFLVLDLPLATLPRLQALLNLPTRLPCPAQALIFTPMPCAGVAACGACAVPFRRGWKRACEDGPVFDLGGISYG